MNFDARIPERVLGRSDVVNYCRLQWDKERKL